MELISKGTPENPKFMVDGKVIVHSFRVEQKENNEDVVAYSMDYDDQLVSEAEALKLADEAVCKIIHDFSKQYEERTAKLNAQNKMEA